MIRIPVVGDSIRLTVPMGTLIDVIDDGADPDELHLPAGEICSVVQVQGLQFEQGHSIQASLCV